MAKKVYKLQVRLNGTSKNPFHPMGLTCNPLPQIAEKDLILAQEKLAILGGDPIPHDQFESYIRETLGSEFIPKFVDLCVQKFVPGEYVKFTVGWKEEV